MSDETKPTRRTIRRYAHELYPHPKDESEIRTLRVEVPHLYALFHGLRLDDTSWYDLEDRAAARARTELYCAAAEHALLADALLQGLTGDAAWTWVQERMDAGDGFQWPYERAEHYGVPMHLIKPYPLGPEPDHHNHMASTGDSTGEGIVTRINIPESKCETCTEWIPAEIPGQLAIADEEGNN